LRPLVSFPGRPDVRAPRATQPGLSAFSPRVAVATMAREAAMHKIEQELEQQCLACKVQYDPPPNGEDNTARRTRRRHLCNTCTSVE